MQITSLWIQKDSNQCTVQQEVDNINIENAAVIIPTLVDVVTHLELLSVT